MKKRRIEVCKQIYPLIISKDLEIRALGFELLFNYINDKYFTRTEIDILLSSLIDLNHYPANSYKHTCAYRNLYQLIYKYTRM